MVDSKARIVKIQMKSFNEIDQANKKGEVLVQTFTKPINSITANLKRKVVVLASENGQVFEYDY